MHCFSWKVNVLNACDLHWTGSIVAPYATPSDEEEQAGRSEDSVYYDALNIWVSLVSLEFEWESLCKWLLMQEV
jgi:hypothetical protein